MPAGKVIVWEPNAWVIDPHVHVLDSMEINYAPRELMQTNYERTYYWRYLRIYELAPTLRDPDALAVLADLFEQANRTAVDAFIKDIGIVGTSILIDSWRPVRLTNDEDRRRLLRINVIAEEVSPRIPGQQT